MSGLIAAARATFPTINTKGTCHPGKLLPMAIFVPDQLRGAAAKIDDGEKTPITVRTLLQWFRSERRGRYVVQMIRDALKEVDLVTVPYFDAVWLDAPIELRRATKHLELSLSDAIVLNDSVAVAIETPRLRSSVVPSQTLLTVLENLKLRTAALSRSVLMTR